jgi:hypothetical protein
MTADTRPNSKFIHLYAIVRFDLPIDPELPMNSVAVVKVFSSQDAANQEASRLNQVNESKNCKYEVCLTRFIA